MADGRQPASRSRMTRCVSTWSCRSRHWRKPRRNARDRRRERLPLRRPASHPRGSLLRACRITPHRRPRHPRAPIRDARQMIVFAAVVALFLNDQARGEAEPAAHKRGKAAPELDERLVAICSVDFVSFERAPRVGTVSTANRLPGLQPDIAAGSAAEPVRSYECPGPERCRLERQLRVEKCPCLFGGGARSVL